jgi:hypothetical protein
MGPVRDVETGIRDPKLPDGRSGGLHRSIRPFEQRVAEVGLEDVFYSRSENEHEINLGFLHRLTLHGLQKELADEVGKMCRANKIDEAQMKTLRAALRDYGELPFSSNHFQFDFGIFSFTLAC